jgi:hypothetical protein
MGSTSSTHPAGEGSRHPMTGNEMAGNQPGGMERHEYDVVVIGAGGAPTTPVHARPSSASPCSARRTR